MFGNRHECSAGYCRVDVNDVISVCRERIDFYNRRRRRVHRRKVRDIFSSKVKKWRRFSRWLGYRPPTRQDAEKEYDLPITAHFDCRDWTDCMYDGINEYYKDIMLSAQVTTEQFIYLSVESINRLGMKSRRH